MTIEESIAKMNLGELAISQIPVIALDWLKSGKQSESLVILAGMNENDNYFEIKQYLDKALDELGVKSHFDLEAAYILAN